LTVFRRPWLGALAVVVVSASGCNYDCNYDVLSRVPSPDGRQDAVTYVASCGAMVGSRWGVSVVPVGASVTTENQARILHYADSLRGSGRSLRRATARWRPDGTLEVGYDARADVITKVAVMSRTPVIYRVD
jgi:hypothetical protein